MKKQLIVDLIKYHSEKDERSFKRTANEIASEFDREGFSDLAIYISSLIAEGGVFVPQEASLKLHYLAQLSQSTSPLYFPTSLEDEIAGVVNAAGKDKGLNKFLFLGAPGSGKTESILQIARFLDRKVLSVNLSMLIDSRLGESAKNIELLFREIKMVPPSRYVILFDEIDAIVLDRINSNDIREMGRVTTAFLKELDSLDTGILLFATSNLKNAFDKALLRRFDAVVDFDCYSREDLIGIAKEVYKDVLKNYPYTKSDLKIFSRILNTAPAIPYPGDIKQVIRRSVAFSAENNSNEHLRRLFAAFHGKETLSNPAALAQMGFTNREIAVLAGMSKSSASRLLNGGNKDA